MNLRFVVGRQDLPMMVDSQVDALKDQLSALLSSSTVTRQSGVFVCVRVCV